MGFDALSPERAEISSDESVTVLYVGRLEHRKGIDILLASIPIILEQISNVRFRIVGDDQLLMPGQSVTFKQQFESCEAGKKWADHIRFEGRVSDSALRSAYKQCDIFVAPSRFESFGLVFLEAMREGKPVVGCTAGGMPEIVVDGVNGCLIAPDDVSALAEAVLTLAKSKAVRHAMGKEGRQIFLENFTSQIMARSSLPIYRLAERNYRDLKR
jgi:glycosyltransferase involved in cell wall biosynthesis